MITIRWRSLLSGHEVSAPSLYSLIQMRLPRYTTVQSFVTKFTHQVLVSLICSSLSWTLSINICPQPFLMSTGVTASPHPYCTLQKRQLGRTQQIKICHTVQAVWSPMKGGMRQYISSSMEIQPGVLVSKPKSLQILYHIITSELAFLGNFGHRKPNRDQPCA